MRSRMARGSGDAAIRILAMGAFEGPAERGDPRSHLLHVLLVEDLLHGQRPDDSTGSPVQCITFPPGVAGVAQGDPKTQIRTPPSAAGRSPRSCLFGRSTAQPREYTLTGRMPEGGVPPRVRPPVPS